jgi:hypothetical protein
LAPPHSTAGSPTNGADAPLSRDGARLIRSRQADRSRLSARSSRLPLWTDARPISESE